MRPTLATARPASLQEVLAGGGIGLRVLTSRGANGIDRGPAVWVDGKIIGAIGVSGGTTDQDGAIAKAGVDELTSSP
jgi:glc operon protein GlcG